MTAADYAGLAICIVLAVYTGVGSVIRIVELRRSR